MNLVLPPRPFRSPSVGRHFLVVRRAYPQMVRAVDLATASELQLYPVCSIQCRYTVYSTDAPDIIYGSIFDIVIHHVVFYDL